MITLSMFDLALGFSAIVIGIYTIVVTSKKYVPKDKTFMQIAGMAGIFFGIVIIAYPYVLNWLIRLKGG